MAATLATLSIASRSSSESDAAAVGKDTIVAAATAFSAAAPTWGLAPEVDPAAGLGSLTSAVGDFTTTA